MAVHKAERAQHSGFSQAHSGEVGEVHASLQPLSLKTVHQNLQQIKAERNLSHDQDVLYVTEMVAFIFDVYNARCESGATWECSDNRVVAPPTVSNSASAGAVEAEGRIILGQLLPLSCGHNKNFTEIEKMALLGHLQALGFVERSD